MAQGSGPSGLFNKFTEAIKKRFLIPTLDSQIVSGRNAIEMPEIPLAELQKSVLACNTGPGAGITDLSYAPDDHEETENGSQDILDRASVIAGVLDWCRPHPRADGLSVSLYEKQLNSSSHHGDPIADAYAIIARQNSCIMALADGINWGQKPRLAARAAILGVLEHLDSKLFQCANGTPLRTTRDIFHHILLSFEEGQRCILKHEGTTTTLTVAIVCELATPTSVSSHGNTRWGLCVVSVGDSPCFLYQTEFGSVHEITAAAHMGKGRDPRDSGGCLGANLGDQPDLSNLICCYLPVSEHDIIFLTSDGISDNFDPVILKQALPDSPVSPVLMHQSSNLSLSSSPPSSSVPSPLPTLNPRSRQDYMTSKMAGILKQKQHRIEHAISAQDIIDALLSYTVNITDCKRTFLEKVWLETSDPSLTPRTRRHKERSLSQQSKLLPGKLDHTTIIAYQVGNFHHSQTQMADVRRPSSQSVLPEVPIRDIDPGKSGDLSSRRPTGAAHPEQFRRLQSLDSFRFLRYKS